MYLDATESCGFLQLEEQTLKVPFQTFWSCGEAIIKIDFMVWVLEQKGLKAIAVVMVLGLLLFSRAERMTLDI